MSTHSKATSRRTFLSSSLLGLTGLLQNRSLCSQSNQLRPAELLKRDRFGGCPAIRFKATGFFRLEKQDRWWFVTPLGNAFLSLGINHAVLNGLKQPVNQDFWLKKFKAKNHRDPAFLQGFREKVRQDVQQFGFNTLGTHSPSRYYPKPFCPYVATIRFAQISHWQQPKSKDFPDVFAESFAADCDLLAKKVVQPIAQDPYLLGYSMADCIILTEQDAASRKSNIYGAQRTQSLPTWPRVLRNLSAKSPGKKAYVACMRKLYQNKIEAFNQTYHTTFDSFAALEQARDWRTQANPKNQQESRDNHEFLQLVIDRYYQVTVGTIRKYDTEHLIFGDKLNGNTDGADVALPHVAKYMDLIYYQTFGFYRDQQPALTRWSKLTEKPFLNGDSSFAVPIPKMPNPYGPHLANQTQRAQTVLKFAQQAFSRPDFVGWHHCGWIDCYQTEVSNRKFKQHSGLQTPFGEYHQPLQKTFSQISQQLYQRGTS